MGISGLLQLLKSAVCDSQIAEFKYKRVAVDGYSWIHKGVYSCCEDLARGKSSDKWIYFCLKRLDYLLDHHIVVYMVFDGANLPAKQATELTRSESREKALEKGEMMKNNGDMKKSRNLISQSIDVTPKMAYELIEVIKQHRKTVNIIVAPYEADAQLAFLSLNNIVDAVISEDSDTIPYGCRHVLFKYDNKTGFCQHLDLDNVFKVKEQNLDLTEFDQDMLIAMCVGSGCDYFTSVKGFGLKNSYKYVQQHKSISNILRAMRLKGLLPLIPMHTGQSSDSVQTLLYELQFYQAYLTFKHQVVYDPRVKEIRYLCPITFDSLPSYVQQSVISSDPSDDYMGTVIIKPDPRFNFDFLGPNIDDSIATGIANGLVDPISFQPFYQPPLPSQPKPLIAEKIMQKNDSSIDAPLNHDLNAIKQTIAKPTGNNYDTKKNRLSGLTALAHIHKPDIMMCPPKYINKKIDHKTKKIKMKTDVHVSQKKVSCFFQPSVKKLSSNVQEALHTVQQMRRQIAQNRLECCDDDYVEIIDEHLAISNDRSSVSKQVIASPYKELLHPPLSPSIHAFLAFNRDDMQLKENTDPNMARSNSPPLNVDIWKEEEMNTTKEDCDINDSPDDRIVTKIGNEKVVIDLCDTYVKKKNAHRSVKNTNKTTVSKRQKRRHGHGDQQTPASFAEFSYSC